MLSQPLNPRLPALARICGRSLLVAYVITVLFAMFPLEFGSPLWGSQLSNRIVDGASLALVGVALLCGTAFLESLPEDPHTDRRRAARLISQRAFALRLCRVGVISLALLAVWQLLLLLGNTGQINQRGLGQSGRIAPVLAKAEQTIRQASPAELEQPWQRFIAAGAPGIKQPVAIATTEQKRQALLAALKAERQQIDRNLNSQGDQARLVMVRDTLRRIALCFVYGGAFIALRRSLA